MRSEAPTFVLYDGDCRVCAAFARALGHIDVHRRIRVRPIQASRDLLPGISGSAVLDAAHAVSPDGRVTSGADAMPTIAGALLGAPRLEAWLRSSRSSRRILSRLYAILVGLRGHLSCGFDGTSSGARSPR